MYCSNVVSDRLICVRICVQGAWLWTWFGGKVEHSHSVLSGKSLYFPRSPTAPLTENYRVLSWKYFHGVSLHKTLIDGLEWCGFLVDYCGVFISCLDSHSDGTHSLQRIHWWASDIMLHFFKSVLMKSNIMSWLAWELIHLQQVWVRFIPRALISWLSGVNEYSLSTDLCACHVNAQGQQTDGSSGSDLCCIQLLTPQSLCLLDKQEHLC